MENIASKLISLVVSTSLLAGMIPAYGQSVSLQKSVERAVVRAQGDSFSHVVNTLREAVGETPTQEEIKSAQITTFVSPTTKLEAYLAIALRVVVDRGTFENPPQTAQFVQDVTYLVTYFAPQVQEHYTVLFNYLLSVPEQAKKQCPLNKSDTPLCEAYAKALPALQAFAHPGKDLSHAEDAIRAFFLHRYKRHLKHTPAAPLGRTDPNQNYFEFRPQQTAPALDGQTVTQLLTPAGGIVPRKPKVRKNRSTTPRTTRRTRVPRNTTRVPRVANRTAPRHTTSAVSPATNAPLQTVVPDKMVKWEKLSPDQHLNAQAFLQARQSSLQTAQVYQQLQTALQAQLDALKRLDLAQTAPEISAAQLVYDQSTAHAQTLWKSAQQSTRLTGDKWLQVRYDFSPKSPLFKLQNFAQEGRLEEVRSQGRASLLQDQISDLLEEREMRALRLRLRLKQVQSLKIDPAQPIQIVEESANGFTLYSSIIPPFWEWFKKKKAPEVEPVPEVTPTPEEESASAQPQAQSNVVPLHSMEQTHQAQIVPFEPAPGKAKRTPFQELAQHIDQSFSPLQKDLFIGSSLIVSSFLGLPLGLIWVPTPDFVKAINAAQAKVDIYKPITLGRKINRLLRLKWAGLKRQFNEFTQEVMEDEEDTELDEPDPSDNPQGPNTPTPKKPTLWQQHKDKLPAIAAVGLSSWLSNKGIGGAEGVAVAGIFGGGLSNIWKNLKLKFSQKEKLKKEYNEKRVALQQLYIKWLDASKEISRTPLAVEYLEEVQKLTTFANENNLDVTVPSMRTAKDAVELSHKEDTFRSIVEQQTPAQRTAALEAYQAKLTRAKNAQRTHYNGRMSNTATAKQFLKEAQELAELAKEKGIAEMESEQLLEQAQQAVEQAQRLELDAIKLDLDKRYNKMYDEAVRSMVAWKSARDGSRLKKARKCLQNLQGLAELNRQRGVEEEWLNEALKQAQNAVEISLREDELRRRNKAYDKQKAQEEKAKKAAAKQRRKRLNKPATAEYHADPIAPQQPVVKTKKNLAGEFSPRENFKNWLYQVQNNRMRNVVDEKTTHALYAISHAVGEDWTKHTLRPEVTALVDRLETLNQLMGDHGSLRYRLQYQAPFEPGQSELPKPENFVLTVDLAGLPADSPSVIRTDKLIQKRLKQRNSLNIILLQEGEQIIGIRFSQDANLEKANQNLRTVIASLTPEGYTPRMGLHEVGLSSASDLAHFSNGFVHIHFDRPANVLDEIPVETNISLNINVMSFTGARYPGEMVIPYSAKKIAQVYCKLFDGLLTPQAQAELTRMANYEVPN